MTYFIRCSSSKVNFDPNSEILGINFLYRHETLHTTCYTCKLQNSLIFPDWNVIQLWKLRLFWLHFVMLHWFRYSTLYAHLLQTITKTSFFTHGWHFNRKKKCFFGLLSDFSILPASAQTANKIRQFSGAETRVKMTQKSILQNINSSPNLYIEKRLK